MVNVSILKKVVMAVTGLSWFGFLITHLTANLMIYQGAETFNAYPEQLRRFGFLLYVAEAGLVALFLGHAISGIKVTLENRRARKKGYAVGANAGKSSFASRTMAIGGIILLVYVPTHVWWFKFGNDWGAYSNGLWGLVVTSFKNPAVVGWYGVAMLALGLHLSHGLSSAAQSLGLGSSVWRARLKITGFVVGWLMAGGFMSLPVWCYLVPAP